MGLFWLRQRELPDNDGWMGGEELCNSSQVS